MSVYSGMHERQSIMEAKGIELSIPGGGATSEADWYPFVMTFNPSAESFCRFIGEANRKLTILYNFPAFDLRWGKGCSRLYDPTSPYYNAFYGAYLVTDVADVSEKGYTSLTDAADISEPERQEGVAAERLFRDAGLMPLRAQVRLILTSLQQQRNARAPFLPTRRFQTEHDRRSAFARTAASILPKQDWCPPV